MRLVGLYAGIGGFELGLGASGFEPVLLADKDENCQRVLNARFTGVEVAGDVAGLLRLPKDVDVVTAGFPCQNLSMAGDKVGIEGSKSRDIQHLFELLQSERPTLVIENVYFMLQLKGGTAMAELVRRVESLGYAWAYRVVDTTAFGLPQRRRRVFFVASVTLDPRTVLFADEAGPSEPISPSLDKPLGFYWTEGRSGVGFSVDGIPPLKVASNLGIPSAPAVLFPDGRVLVPGIDACERLQGFPAGWTDANFPPKRSPRWRMVGNAVSVPAAAWVGERLASPGDILDLPSRPLQDGDRWPSAASGGSGTRRVVQISDRPVRRAAPSIVDFLDDGWWALSPRALRGFISRVNQGGLRVPDGFVGRLEAALHGSHDGIGSQAPEPAPV
ncbi:DNA cytosine methyltransferase [Aureimonas jatrophae]|uniref:Cytosine-specific methyltransferase n=1 Tax=Aureimonas jatrophae TaxID=1166073 RepID=A0A1H0M391_9HYPH|nr:DNA (cytosine-5-)-methyltransferase [Aureimonas jatrophae]MBB3952642.1 DNA (cytosine-5)-methyltransferase 1 [Aureimonas jatrophae]SDO74845.1 DNA (cytosine-5)-methyltransferase 1 [Aureimonas jatrophae]